jgi:hypothetical protein
MPTTGHHVAIVRGPSPLEVRIDGATVKGKTSTEDIRYPGVPVVIGMVAGVEAT